MSEQENIRIVKQAFDRLNDHNLERDSQTTAGNLRVQTVDSPTEMNFDEYRTYMRRMVDAFPDMHFTIRDIIAQGDKVAVSYTVKGTHKGALSGPNGLSIPATNRLVTLSGYSFYELRNNQISRVEIIWDRFAFWSQLGVLSEQELVAKVRH